MKPTAEVLKNVMRVTERDLARHDNVAERLFVAIENYAKASDSVMREISNLTVFSPQWRGALQLSCALNGLAMVPIDNISPGDGASYWRKVRISETDYVYLIEHDFYSRTP